MDMKFFDAHTHVQFAAYEKDRELVIGRALREGVGMVNVGTKKETSRWAVELTEKFPNVWATIGLHPIHSHKSLRDVQEVGGGTFEEIEEVFDYDFYKKLALDPKVVAIGECGLDYAVFVRKRSERLQKRASAESVESGEGGLSGEEIERMKAKQKKVFEDQIQLVHEVKKPLMIHCRDAFNDLIDILLSNKNLLNSSAGIAHFFSGTKEEAKKLLDLGFYFTFGGTITFPFKVGKHFDYGELVRFIPVDRILSETDAPYVAPMPYRGTRNEPAYVAYIVKKLAEIKNISVSDMQDRILENAGFIFPAIFK